jgi:hypothetical protein
MKEVIKNHTDLCESENNLCPESMVKRKIRALSLAVSMAVFAAANGCENQSPQELPAMEMECDFGVDKQLLKDLDKVDASAADNEDADAGTK